MHRLYFRIYMAVLGSLALLAVLAAAAWHLLGDVDRIGPRPEFFSAAVEQLVPPAIAPPEIQRASLEHWRNLSGFDLALFGRDGQLIADASDGTLWAPASKSERFGPARWRPHFWTSVVQLSDGRWLVAARPRAERAWWRRFAWLLPLAALTLAVGVSAYPVVRRLTRRLEALQSSVAALGAGNLAARVPVEGRDEIARLAETFNLSADHIEQLIKANKSLLANASHELRSPLARLRMGLEALEVPPSSRNALSRNIKELDQLIEEILLASRLDAQPADRADFEPVDLVALLAEECAGTGADLTAAGPVLPMIHADARLLRRMIRNLLENAQRHGGGNAVEVTVSTVTAGNCIFDVCDRGPGVPANERERIFEPFHRLPGSRERDGSVGLGLALARQITSRHGGSVTCLPRDGGGSCFRVQLPTSPDAITL